MVDPTYPGEDLPTRGRSLFDFLTVEKRGDKVVQAVPFPFAALLQRVDARMRLQPGAAGTAAVLIPLGRSLQRMAAAPEFFAFPRAVAAAVGEPAGSGAPLLKDRLYLGYQEKASVLEVISYNEDAARFEFQIVTDYRAGGSPRVAYANRALCTACHQSAAPIFSRQVWDETNSNPAVAARLAAQHKDFHGIPVDRGVDVPNAIDDAKLRANQFALYQLLWREGCGGNDQAAVRCRAALFTAVLQYRLSGLQHFDRAAPAYRNDAAARLVESARQRWPAGLALGNPDLPNRNPLANAGPAATALGPHDWANLANVTAAFDPLRLRPPLEVWRITGENDIARLVAGLAEFVAEPDVERIDHELFRRGAGRGGAHRSHDATCSVTVSPIGKGSQRIEFNCTPSPSTSGPGAAIDGHLTLMGSALVDGAIDRIEIDGQSALRDFDLALRRYDSRGAQPVAVLAPTHGNLHARGADGNAIEQIEFRWARGKGTARLMIVDDFAPVNVAIAVLANDNLDGKFDGFSDAAFRRARLLPALFSGLGLTSVDACCLDASILPPPQTSPIGAHGTAAPAHARFNQYCGQCHLGAERTPPNFLAGDTAVVEANLRRCAPRMFVRLSMWQSSPDVRAKSPMPPDVALHRLQVSADAWRDGEALAALLQSTWERLRAETGRSPELDGLLRGGYENLRSCLPD